jgi:hypothetical protein
MLRHQDVVDAVDQYVSSAKNYLRVAGVYVPREPYFQYFVKEEELWLIRWPKQVNDRSCPHELRYMQIRFSGPIFRAAKKLWQHYGFRRAARASRKAARLFLSTIVIPVSTRAGMAGHFVHGTLGWPHVQVSGAGFEFPNSCTALL